MRLNETEMVKLLPAWMQEDGSDKGLATGCDIISRDAYARLKLLSRWDKIDQLNDAELDEMAWELNIQWYDSTAPIAVKRAVIRSSDRVYAKLGTPYAVEQIVADYFGTGEVREWYQYGGQPHHFKVLSDNPSLVNSNLDLFLKLLRTVKRRSSWLDAILICLTGEMFLYSGMAVRDHTQEVHVMGSDEIHIYHAAVVHDNNRETVSIGTDAAVISDYGWTSVQYRVKAYDAAGAESAYTTSASRTVTNNRPPVISGKDGALGSFSTAAPSYEYTVTDADGHQVDVVEMLDGVTLRRYTVTLGQTNTLTIGAEAWLKVVNGSHTLKIVATDAKDASVTRTLTFTKAVTSVEFEQTVAMEADAMPTKALVNIQGNFPAGCTLQIWICNNGNDASPTWEDITQKARTGQKHYFTNKAKTAAAWGVKVKAKLLRGSATETCYIQSIGGNFA